jgi:hypothetical protein
MARSTAISVAPIKSLKDLKTPAQPAPLNPPKSPPKPSEYTLTTMDGAREWFEAQLRRAREHGIFTIRETLTNALARLLLDENPDNRVISPSKIKQMAESMRAGTFQSDNGQTIIISKDGCLNDGQHRLHAKLESLVDFPMLFVFGVERDSRLTIDQGRPRTSGDFVTMRGLEYGGAAAAIGALLIQYRREGALRSRGGSSYTQWGRSEIADFTRENYEQIRLTLDAIRPRAKLSHLGGIGVVGLCHLLFAEKDFAAATDFINRLIMGNDLADTSPINVARNRLLMAKRLKREEKYEIIVRAWNAWRLKKEPAFIPVMNRVPEIKG